MKQTVTPSVTPVLRQPRQPERSQGETEPEKPAQKRRRMDRRRKRDRAFSMRRALMVGGAGASATGAGGETSEMGEDVDPATGLINLADLMLVFACGLMLALVAHWNIDLGPQINELTENKDMTEVTDLEDAKDLLANNSGYSEVGVVYRDPETNKLYLLTEDLSLQGGEAPVESSAETP